MTKADIIEEIVTSTGITKKDVSTTVEAFMEAIKNSLLEKKDEQINRLLDIIEGFRKDK